MSKQVSIDEFEDIFKISVELHKSSNDPIPALSKQSVEKMKGCLSMPFMTFGGVDLYKTIYDKASILFYLINKGHNLENGNKRMSYIITEYFLFKNNINLNLTDDEIYSLTLKVAESKSEDKDEILKYISKKLNTKKDMKKFNPQSLIGRTVWKQSGASGVFKILKIKEVEPDNIKMEIGTDSYSMTVSYTMQDLIDLSKGKIIKDLELLKETKMAKGGDVENTDWKVGGFGQKYIDYKLGTIHLKDDGSYMVKYGVNIAPTRAKTLAEAKKQLDKYEADKMAKGGDISSKEYYVFEGYDHKNSKPLYKVSSKVNEYDGEWHTNKRDAELELKGLLNKPSSNFNYSIGGL
jgi:prophage maintenance system killer protein